MKNKLYLSELETYNIKSMHNLINEQNTRTISKYELEKNDWRKYNSEGLVPYYLNTSSPGNYKLVEIREPNSHSIKYDPNVDRIFLLSPEQMPSIQKLIDSVNELTSEYRKIIDLYRQQLIGSIEKIVG
jgi:hypothetical protein